MSPLRNSRVLIDHSALKHNFQCVKQLAPDSKVMPVIKADAYGHGMADVAMQLDQADAYAVAMLGEAVALREAGVSKPIVVFHGYEDMEQLQQMAHLQLQPAIHHLSQLQLLESYSGAGLDVWLKIDTGMHRLGIALEQVDDYVAKLSRHPSINGFSMMSHFANADVPDNSLNTAQIENMLKANNTVGAECSLANSAAVCALSNSHLDWVRPGIMLYGASPLTGVSAESLGLQPVMRFESRLISVQHLHADDAIGYGSSWRCPQDMAIGIVPVGYGDGYPRHASNGTPVAVNGVRTSLIGRVSMDSLYVDIRGMDAEVGDPVELWGDTVPVDEVAQSAATIAYELLCAAGNTSR